MRKFWTASVAAMAFTLIAAPASAQDTAPASAQQAWTVSGEITDSDPGGREPHYDNHTIRLEAGQRYLISVDSTAFDAVAQLYRAGTAEPVAQNDDGSGLNPRIRYTATESGDYTLRVLGFSAEARGAYTATLASLPPLQPGVPVPWSASGRIETSDPATAGDDGYHYDEYTLRLEAGRRYILRVQASDFDPIARLYPAGEDNAVAENDDDGDGLNSRISFAPETSGDYTLRVAPLAGDGRGSYRASAELAPPLPPARTEFQRMTSVAFRVYEGELANGDGDAPDGAKVDDYVVHFNAGQERLIQLDAANFDAVVQVLAVNQREGGETLASNDDGGNSLNSLLRFKADTAGDYIVRVTSLGAGGRGAYTLRVSE